MRTRFINIWDDLRTSYWFVPGLLAVLAIGLSVLTIHLDEHLKPSWARSVGWIWAGGPEGARKVLSTIASSMIGVAGVTFSITIVALQLASTQFGPRVLRNFMTDTGNQVVLGTFVATFLYCLLVLRTVRGLNQDEFVPNVSVTAGVILAVLSLAVLIYFFHHVSQLIRAEHLIAAVAHDFETSLNRLYGEDDQDRRYKSSPRGNTEHELKIREAFRVEAGSSGYLQAIEMETLMEAAKEHDLALRLSHRPGDFITRGEVLAQAMPGGRCEDSIASSLRQAFILGRQRTPRQDIRYSVNQFAEIAVRSLSPGINDPYTAVICIDWISACLASLARKTEPDRRHCDGEGHLRIVAARTSFGDVMDAAFHPIREYGSGSAEVMVRALHAIAHIAPEARRHEDREALRNHARLLAGDAQQALKNEHDRQTVEAAYRKAISTVGCRCYEPAAPAGGTSA
jgi:uncharacterized membrane protein